jgi:alkylation response protein AidB-like acyl-CoA dehydrogenase
MRLTSEQNELRDLLHRFFAEKVGSEYLRSRISKQIDSDPAFNQELEALGLFEGFRGDLPAFSAQELGLVAEECGYFLVPEPLIEQLIATGLAPHFVSQADRNVLESVNKGGEKGSIAYPECCNLSLDASGSSLTGSISWALGLGSASWLLAFSETPQGPRLSAFSLKHQGVSLKRKTALDLTTTLHSVEISAVPCVIFDESSSMVIEDLLEAAKASEVAGICKRAIEMTVEYSKTRQQFGVAIGSFQALQQKLADCYARSEALASLARFATWSASHSTHQRHVTARAAVLEASQVGPLVCEAAIQAHGGIGFTWEYDLHLYLRRAKAIQAAFSLSEVRARALIDFVATI